MAERQSELIAGSTTTSGATPEQLRDNIRRTRANMDETVDAIGERLRPRHLLDDVIDLFRGSSSGADATGSSGEASTSMRDAANLAKDYGATAFEKLKAHPMPAALIAAGVAWMLLDDNSDGDRGSSRRGSSGRGRLSRQDVRGHWRDGELREYNGSFVDARTGQPYDDTYGNEYAEGRSGSAEASSDTGGMMSKVTGAAKSVGEGISSAASSVADAASSAASAVADAASSAKRMAGDATRAAGDYAGTAGDYAGRAGGTVSQYGRQARDRSGEAYDSASYGMRRGAEYSRQSFEQSLERYPLAVIGAALAGGMLAGLLLPTTRRENELMGERSDRLKESVKTQVQETGETLLEKGKEVADATKDVANKTLGAVSEEAGKQGISPDSLAEKVKHVARDVVGAAKESARREGLTDIAQKGKGVVERGKEVVKDEARQQKDRITKK